VPVRLPTIIVKMSNTQSKIRARIAEWNKQPDIINDSRGAVKAVAINELEQALEWLAEEEGTEQKESEKHG
jgi:hypothetical protein